jgi:photosystem II stability/assembly factor-like uncharacterized protein
VIDPTNESIMYAGSVSGGVWKTTNGGTTWVAMTDNQPNLIIDCLLLDPRNPNTIYAGTGEGYFNYDYLSGIGILKTTDGGVSWTTLTNFSPALTMPFIYKMVMDPTSSSIIYAAAFGGVYKTTNSGASWSLLPILSQSEICTDLCINASNGNILYASFGLFASDGIYETTNAGASWSRLSNGYPTDGFARTSICIVLNDPSVLYACLEDSVTSGTYAIEKTTDGGASWSKVATPFDNDPLVNATSLGNQGWYNNVIEASFSDPNTVYTGGIDLFKSTNGGTSWDRISDGYVATTAPNYVHVDQHAIVLDPSNESTIYFGNDGGVFMSTDAGSSFSSLNNGYVTAQFYSGRIHPSQNVYFGGTQDNGTLESSGSTDWTEVYGGDGGATAIDHSNPNIFYTEYVYLTMLKSTDGGNSWNSCVKGIPSNSSGTTDRCLFFAPYVMDPSNSSTLVAGTYRVYRTTNAAASWTPISGNITGDPGGPNAQGSDSSTISALAIAKSNSAYIYSGTTGSATAISYVYVTTNTGSTWTNVTGSNMPNRWIKCIAVDPTNPNRVFVCFSGYNANTPGTPGHIFMTTDLGLSWTDVSNNLPDIPVNAMLIDPGNTDNLLVGTDIGMFSSYNGGTTWTQENGGMANVEVLDLDRRDFDSTVIAATHGRGMFSVSLATGVIPPPPVIPSSYLLEQNYPNPFNPGTRIPFTISTPSHVTIKLYNILGQEVTTIVDRNFSSTPSPVYFLASGLASGDYYYRMTATDLVTGKTFTDVKKMNLIK